MILLDDGQKQDVDLLVSHDRWGLFNETGTGKSYPAIEAALQNLPALLTVPAYLIPQWTRYVEQYAPGTTVRVIDGRPVDKNEKLLTPADFTLVSYATWQGQDTRYKQIIQQHTRWGCMVWDESQRLRGRNSSTTNSVFKAANKSSRNHDTPMWFLTGTPLVRDVGDLWPFLYLCDRKQFTSYWRFVKKWANVVETPWGSKVGTLLDPEAFYGMVSQYSSRRELSGLDMPRLIDIPVEISRALHVMINQAKKSYQIEFPDGSRSREAVTSGSALWSKIRRWTTVNPIDSHRSPKLDALKGLLDDNSQERVIVWVFYRDSARAVYDFLRQEVKDRPVGFHMGGNSTAENLSALRQYTKEAGVLVATISSLSTGVNLQDGHVQVFLEESTLPSDNKQAVARQWRRGQTKPVLVYRVFAERTVDTSVRKLASGRDTDHNRVVREFLNA